jgi:hypothetical protein
VCVCVVVVVVVVVVVDTHKGRTGWSSRNADTSYTLPSMMTQQSLSLLWVATSSRVILRGPAAAAGAGPPAPAAATAFGDAGAAAGALTPAVDATTRHRGHYHDCDNDCDNDCDCDCDAMLVRRDCVGPKQRQRQRWR